MYNAIYSGFSGFCFKGQIIFLFPWKYQVREKCSPSLLDRLPKTHHIVRRPCDINVATEDVGRTTILSAWLS